MAIDTSVPDSDGWWLARLYGQLREQRIECQKLWDRYEGNAPLPTVNHNQAEAVRWFIGQSRTNFERLIVAAVLSRLRIRGIRTAADDDEGGDADAFKTWKRARGKLWALEAHKFALTMRRGYVIVGKDDNDRLLVTAEDPRQVTAVVDPTDPTRVLAAVKLFYDEANQQDVVYLYRPGRIVVARRDRSPGRGLALTNRFQAQAFNWEMDLDGNVSALEPDWLQADGDTPALCPVVVFENDDAKAEFEPHLPLLDRINKQILDRMTIATVQAFKQRAMKGLPKTDPKTGEPIDYDSIFVSDPGAIWNIPASVEIWESGQVDLGPVLMAVRDDIRDLAAVSGTPLYTITPDMANGSAEGAMLQRETLTFKVESKQDRWEMNHEAVAELMFRTEGDTERGTPGTVEIMWSPADRLSMSERANAIAQTKGAIPRYIQLTEIWGFDPATADRAMTLLQSDAQLDMAMAAVLAAKKLDAHRDASLDTGLGRGSGSAAGAPGQSAAPGQANPPKPQTGALAPREQGPKAPPP